MSETLWKKIALVTGGSRGLGAAIASALADAGADVAISSVLATEKASAVVDRLKAKGVRAIPIKALQRIADYCETPIQTLILAHLLLDENIAAISADPQDAASKALLQLAQHYRHLFPDGVKDAAALGLLYESARMIR